MREMHFHYWLSIPKRNPLPLQKVMHTRKRHMELFQELNQKFQTLDRFRDIPNMGTMVSNRKPGEGRAWEGGWGKGGGRTDGQFKPVGRVRWGGTRDV